MTHHFSVTTSLKKEVLDAEGRTICDTLNSSGFKTVRSVAVAKTIFLAVEEQTTEKASEVAHKVAKEFLCNPVSHVYTLTAIREEDAPR
jgi:phosphoribosylformylglycinamidine synthase PurS subunit